MGNAAHLLGVRPDDWAHYTVEDADHLLDWLEAYEKDQQEQAAKMKRR